MAQQIKLRNGTGWVSIVGRQVKLDPTKPNNFIYANYYDNLIIGTVANAVPQGNQCLINLLNTVAWNDVLGVPTFLPNAYETVSKNLKSYPYVLVYGVDGLDTITYDLGGGLSIVKTFNYTVGVLTSLVLSGDTPDGIDLTKTFSYTGVDLTGVSYS